MRNFEGFLNKINTLANATIQVPGKEPVEFTIREISKFAHVGKSFNNEPVTLAIGTVSIPNQVVKIKLDGKTLGELDSDSVKQLQAFNYIKDGNQLNLKLTTISDSKENAFAIASSPNGNLLKINKINFYDYQGQKFNDENYRKLTLEVAASKTRDAVFLGDEPLGVLHFKKDKEALKELGVLQFGKLTSVQATLQSNFTTTVLKVDPSTVEYPEVWTKEIQAFGTHKVNQDQQQMIEKAAPILQKIKERPTILFASAEDKMLGITQMAVDNHKVATVTKWLQEQNVAFASVSSEDVPLETKKGLAIFNLVNSSIPESVYQAMTLKFGEVIESQSEYQQKMGSLPDRPKYLKPPQLSISSTNISTKELKSVKLPQTPQITNTKEPKTQAVVIIGKPIPMNFPLMMHGEQNSLPVNTCIDAMRGHGRVHTTRAYEPYKQYGFKEGDIAIASGGGKQVAFGVGKQYQITPEMIADPFYQKQWANMEKHSAKALPELFTGKQEVWGLHMKPLGDYVDGKIIPFPEVQKKATPNQELPLSNLTIDNLREWYSVADKLGKSEEYKKRIVEVANQFKSGRQLSPEVLAGMGKDTEEYQSISRLTKIAQRIGDVLGQPGEDGFTYVRGKIYDLVFNAQTKDLVITYGGAQPIAQKNGEVILSVQSGKVQTNKVTPEILQAFENANTQIDQKLAQSREKNREFYR